MEKQPSSDAEEVRFAGNWIESYLKCTKGQESPILFHLWVAITVIAAALRQNVHMPMGHFKIFPNFYTILVSPSGTCRKSTAISIGESFLYHVDGLNIFRTKLTPEALLTFLKAEAEIVQTKPDVEGSEGTGTAARSTAKDLQQPTTNQQSQQGKEQASNDKSMEEEESETEDDDSIETEDGSTKAQEEALESAQKSTSTEFIERTSGFVVASELSTMFGAASYVDDLKFLLTDLYDNKANDEYATKKGGRVKLHNVNLNLLGGSNPTWLARSFSEDAFGGGFMGRTIFVYQEEGSRIPWPEKSEELELLEQMLIADLQRISRLQGTYQVTDEAKEFYANWYINSKLEAGTRMAGYFERKHIHLLKIAMILVVAEGDKLLIDVRHCEAALALLAQIEAWMPDAFAYIGATTEARVEQQILEYLRSHKGYAKAPVLLKHVRKSVKGKKEFSAIMATLEASGTVVSRMKDDDKGNKDLYYVFTEAYLKQKAAQDKRHRERKEREAKQEQERKARQEQREKRDQMEDKVK